MIIMALFSQLSPNGQGQGPGPIRGLKKNQFGEVGHRTDVNYIITYLWRNGGRTTAFVVGFSHACYQFSRGRHEEKEVFIMYATNLQ